MSQEIRRLVKEILDNMHYTQEDNFLMRGCTCKTRKEYDDPYHCTKCILDMVTKAMQEVRREAIEECEKVVLLWAKENMSVGKANTAQFLRRLADELHQLAKGEEDER